MVSLATERRRYAEELRAAAGVESERLLRAFATVPRERFLGPGPWQILVRTPDGDLAYTSTGDADARSVYRNVLVAIDPGRGLNNGAPASWAAWIEALDLQPGERVVHVGCGTGYYTAVMAEIVGPTGKVLGIEVDSGLAQQAESNLAYLSQVQVTPVNGAELDAGAVDVIVVNAGVTHPSMMWLNALLPGGRLLLPLTGAEDLDGIGFGGMLLISRRPNGYAATCVSPVGIFSCVGVRDPEYNRQLLEKPDVEWQVIRSLRRDAHEADSTCFLHTPAGCVSTCPLGTDAD